MLCLHIMDDRDHKKAMLEAVLFLSAEPVMPAQLKGVSGLEPQEITALLDELLEDYEERQGGILLGRIAGGYQLYANPNETEWARRLRGVNKSQKLSPASLETLAIIAYKQPITKIEVEDIRGVNADGVLKSLLDKRLIMIVGKKEAPGKPILYGTTKDFLQYFGLNELSELPTLKDLQREEAA